MLLRGTLAAATVSMSLLAAPVKAGEGFYCTTQNLGALLYAISQTYRIPLPVFYGIIDQESRWNARAVSKAGAIGLMQVMPVHARRFGLDTQALFDPCVNVQVGAYFFAEMYYRYNGNIDLALAAYNAGPGSVDRAGTVPEIGETKRYVRAVKSKTVNYARIYGTNFPIRYLASPVPSQRLASMR